VRISKSERTAAWVKATYYSNTDGVAAFGSEVVLGGFQTYTVELTEALATGMELVSGLALTEKVNLAAALSAELSLEASKVQFRVPLVTALNAGFEIASGLAVALIGRDLWSFNSFITKIMERDSAIEKITAKDSRITKYFDEDSSVR